MIATRSQTSSISLSRCELRRTATPRVREVLEQRADGAPAGGVERARGLVEEQQPAATPISAWAIPSRCCIPFDIASIAPIGGLLEADEPSSSARSATPPSRAGEPLVEAQQLVGACTSPGSGTARRGSRGCGGAAEPAGAPLISAVPPSAGRGRRRS